MKFGKKLKTTWKKNSEPVYNKKFPKSKIKCYNRKINTNSHDNKIPKEGFQYICLSVIFINSVFRTVKYYYPQVFFRKI